VISDPSTLASALSAPLSFHHPCRPNLLHPYRHPLLLNCHSLALTHFPHVNHLPRLNYLPRLNSFPRLNHLPRLNCPPLSCFLSFTILPSATFSFPLYHHLVLNYPHLLKYPSLSLFLLPCLLLCSLFLDFCYLAFCYVPSFLFIYFFVFLLVMTTSLLLTI
jgi:hypothetical protein